MAEPDMLQMTKKRIRFACCITKGTDTHTGYVTLTVFPQKQWLQDRACVLLCTDVDCLIC
jgi:hypothetical protein